MKIGIYIKYNNINAVMCKNIIFEMYSSHTNMLGRACVKRNDKI